MAFPWYRLFSCRSATLLTYVKVPLISDVSFLELISLNSKKNMYLQISGTTYYRHKNSPNVWHLHAPPPTSIYPQNQHLSLTHGGVTLMTFTVSRPMLTTKLISFIDFMKSADTAIKFTVQYSAYNFLDISNSMETWRLRQIFPIVDR